MKTSAQRTGQYGENIAVNYLQKRKYQIIETNWQYKGRNEIDIVAVDKGTLVFVEVRARRGNNMLSPQETITPKKYRNLRIAAQLYKKLNPETPDALRIDLVSISFSRTSVSPKIKLLRNISV
ncbi:MAG: YraN family protein [Patescibacteria group bacterium]